MKFKPSANTFKRILQRVRIGDAVATITQYAGIPQCEPCKRRQAILNGETIPPHLKKDGDK